MYPNIVTNETITIVINGVTHTIKHGAPNFKIVREAIKNKNKQAVRQAISLEGAVEVWSKGLFKLDGEAAYFNGELLPPQITDRLLTMKGLGEDPQPLINFWIRLQNNPSMRSVEQLYPFLEHQGIAIQPDGTFLAYKGVNPNYTDKYTGTVDNKPGAINEMNRNKVSDDPNRGCHYGYHVGAFNYASSFASDNGVVVVCQVDPADVVCIPIDNSYQKMRVCKYRVLGNHNGVLLPSTTFEDDFLDEERAEIEDTTEYKELEPGTKEKVIKGKRAALKVKVPGQFKAIHELKPKELYDVPLSDLRKYASLVLHIVGASKIPGGKTALILEITKARRRLK